MKKALIHDWLDRFGGAERVLSAINEVIDFEYYYAYVNKMQEDDMKRVFGRSGMKVEDLRMPRVLKPFFRYLMPIFPFIVKRFNKQTKNNKVDLVISSSWALSKSYRVGNEVHICYLQSRNFKYVWEESDKYFKGPLKMLSFLKPILRKFDVNGGRNPDFLISNSYFVKDWVKEHYGRESVVIYPPVDIDDFYISETKEDYYITVGRLEPYKRFDVVVDAFAKNGKTLYVIGDGTQMPALRQKATENIHFLGYKTKEEIKILLSRAKAFVFSGVEDFGIAIVEALASGVPVIAYRGGASEEIINEKNGLLYDQQTVSSLNDIVNHFINEVDGKLDATEIRASAQKFSKARFQEEFSTFVEAVVAYQENDVQVVNVASEI